MSHAADAPEEIHQHSGWLIPLGILFAIALLSGLFLLYDLRPGFRPREGIRTADPMPIDLSVRGARLRVPANYLDNPREGAERDLLTLSALLPGMRGYSLEDADLFNGNAPDSPVVHLLFKGDENDLDASARLERIYKPYILEPDGTATDFGLTQYNFRADSGYGREDLFTGREGGLLLLFLCERASLELPSPNCLAIGRPVARNLSFSYRFKRAYLARWNEIAAGVDGLLARFQAR